MNLQDYIIMPNGVKTHFQYGEFVKSDTATRLGITLKPTPEQWKRIEELTVNILEPLRSKFGRIRITSGFRSTELCNAISSDPKSNHTKGEAADIEPLASKISLLTILNYIHKNLPHRELIAEYFPNGWVHVAYRSNANDRILKLKDSAHLYAKVKISYINELYT